MQVIIYKIGDNVAVIYPAPEFSDQLPAIAAKDVPAGTPWRVIDDGDLPKLDAHGAYAWSDEGPLGVELPSIAGTRAQAKAAMEAWIGTFLAQFTAGVPSAELASWSVKAARARQHLAGAPQAMIMAEAAITSEDATALAQKIAAKADAYEAIIARVTGLRRATEAAINAAGTPEAVAAVLAGAQSKAQALAASLGIGLA